MLAQLELEGGGWTFVYMTAKNQRQTRVLATFLFGHYQTGGGQKHFIKNGYTTKVVQSIISERIDIVLNRSVSHLNRKDPPLSWGQRRKGSTQDPGDTEAV